MLKSNLRGNIHLIISNPDNHLQKFESVSKELQEEDVNLSIARTMFDGLLSDLQSKNLEKYLGNNGKCAYPAFETAVICAIEEKTLSTEQKYELRQLAGTESAVEIVSTASISYADKLMHAKRRKPNKGIREFGVDSAHL